jgi:glycosyltransferase involved in cell wall biosynthesis
MTVLYAGALTRRKGVLELVQAVQRVRNSGLLVHLAVCGDGPLRATLQANAGVQQGWLELPGSVASDQIIQRMRSAWIVVVPSQHAFPEALPLVIVESLSTRTPVVLSDHPIFREYFTEEQGIRMFRAGDVSALALALIRLAADPVAYRVLSDRTLMTWHALQIDCQMHHLFERFAGQAGIVKRG